MTCSEVEPEVAAVCDRLGSEGTAEFVISSRGGGVSRKSGEAASNHWVNRVWQQRNEWFEGWPDGREGSGVICAFGSAGCEPQTIVQALRRCRGQFSEKSVRVFAPLFLAGCDKQPPEGVFLCLICFRQSVSGMMSDKCIVVVRERRDDFACPARYHAGEACEWPSGSCSARPRARAAACVREASADEYARVTRRCWRVV